MDADAKPQQSPTPPDVEGPSPEAPPLRRVQAQVPLTAIRGLSPLKVSRRHPAGALEVLGRSQDAVGQLQPVGVRRVADATYELLWGELRWRAALQRGSATLEALILEGTDAQVRRALLDEELCRSPLWLPDQDALLSALVEDEERAGGGARRGRPAKGTRPTPSATERVAAACGRDESTVRKACKRHRHLTSDVKEAYGEGRLTQADADRLADVSPEEQPARLQALLERRSQARAEHRSSVQQSARDASEAPLAASGRPPAAQGTVAELEVPADHEAGPDAHPRPPSPREGAPRPEAPRSEPSDALAVVAAGPADARLVRLLGAVAQVGAALEGLSDERRQAWVASLAPAEREDLARRASRAAGLLLLVARPAYRSSDRVREVLASLPAEVPHA